MSARFTAGPWVAKRAADGCGDIGIVADNGCVAECYHAIRFHDEKAHEECLANARLIAAAPELYAALLQAQEYLHDIAPAMEYDANEVLLRKARGEA